MVRFACDSYQGGLTFVARGLRARFTRQVEWIVTNEAAIVEGATGGAASVAVAQRWTSPSLAVFCL